MKDWEFLIQQAGDRPWLSLAANFGSLTTGNYRMVARTPYPKQALSITLSHQGIMEPSPSLLFQADRQTNEEGWVMVFPYRDLPAGTWQLSLSPQGSADSSSLDALEEPGEVWGEVGGETGEEVWEKAIAFQVTDYLTASQSLPDPEPEINSTAPLPLIPLPSPQIWPETWPEIGLEAPYHHPHFSLSESSSNEAMDASVFPLMISLERNEFSDLGQAFLLLAGKVEALSPEQPLDFPARLRYRLQDLDSAAYLLDEPKSWLSKVGEVLPFTFQETLVLPPTQARDLLGELSIETEAGEILAQIVFNLTLSSDSEEDGEEEAVNYTIELSNLENQSSFTFEVIVPKEAAETPLNVDLPNPAKMNRLLRRSPFLDRPVLPPKIQPSLAKSPAKKSLQLPKITPS